jgi:Na+/melibiose symporter-like transporter
MQDADLFMELAAIAGVFVGFGALIAARSGGPSEPQEVAPMRGVVSLGMLTVVAALAPVTLGRFDLTQHQVWALSSALSVVGLLILLVSMAGTREYRASWAAELEATRAEPPALRWWRAGQGAFWAVWQLAILLVPIVILLGLAQELEAALYFADVVLILLGAGLTLLSLVFAQRRPSAA